MALILRQRAREEERKGREGRGKKEEEGRGGVVL